MRISNVAKWALWAVVAVLAIGVANFSVNRLKHSDPKVLLSYEVPPEIAEEVHSALHEALHTPGPDGAPLGQVTLLPNGRLLVTAPMVMQVNVQQVLRDIAKQKPGPTPTIAFDVWVVKATAGLAPSATVPLKEIEPALTTIRKNQGPLHFELLEKLSTHARPGREASRISGAVSQVQIHASQRKIDSTQSLVAAKIELSMSADLGSSAGLEAQAEMRPGELLVLGQSALAGRDAVKTSAQLYYIVRATL